MDSNPSPKEPSLWDIISELLSDSDEIQGEVE